MRLIYLTGQKYPSKKTEPFFWKSMAHGFHAVLGGNFTFVVRDTAPSVLSGLPIVSVPTGPRFVSAAYFFRLPTLIKTHGWNAADTVFFSQDSYMLVLLILLKKLRGYTYRIAADWHQLFGDWRDGYIARHATHHLTTSERLKRVLVERTGVEATNVQVAYGGVNLALYAEKRKLQQSELRQRLGLPIGILVGYVGAFMSVAGEKGLATMIETLPSLPPEYRMVFAGDRAGHGEPYRQLAQKLGVAERCTLLPWLSYEQYVECQLAMDVLVIPYPDKPHYRDFGFPMKVWEYMAAGRPIVYSDLPIVREALEGRGKPFRPGDSCALAAAVEKAASDPAQEAVAQKNTEDAGEYTWDARAARILSFLSSQS